MKSEFKIALAPGPLDVPALRAIVERVIGLRGWLKPTAYGDGEPDEIPLRVPQDPLPEVEVRFRDSGRVGLAEGKAAYLLIWPDQRDLSFLGAIHGAGDARKLTADQISDLVAIARAPLAIHALTSAVDAFARRWVTAPDGSEEVKVNVPGYHRGLEHPHWRMWFGREWTEFLGRDVLARAPAVVSRPEGEGWFVQVLERPEDWDKPAGIQAASRFAEALRKNVLFDLGAPDRILEAPDFSALMAAARAKYPKLNEFVPRPPSG